MWCLCPERGERVCCRLLLLPRNLLTLPEGRALLCLATPPAGLPPLGPRARSPPSPRASGRQAPDWGNPPTWGQCTCVHQSAKYHSMPMALDKYNFFSIFLRFFYEDKVSRNYVDFFLTISSVFLKFLRCCLTLGFHNRRIKFSEICKLWLSSPFAKRRMIILLVCKGFSCIRIRWLMGSRKIAD